MGASGVKPAPAYAPESIPCPTCKSGELTYVGTRWRCNSCGQNVIRPQKGPQERFSSSEADVVIYGGSAGGGKSWALLFEAARHSAVPGYSAVIFRRTSPEITAPRGLWDESIELYPVFGGRSRETNRDWRFQTDGAPAIIAFSHLQHEIDKLKHHGAQYCNVSFDELTHFEESQFWYLFSRNRSTCGVRPLIRASTNPDPDSWVRELIDWWIGDDGLPIPERDGVLRYFVRDGDDLVWCDSPEEVVAKAPAFNLEDVKSLTFIRSCLEDNRILMEKDPGYRATLLAMPRVERERLLGGNWNIKAQAGDYFRREWYEVLPAPAKLRKTVRAWDLAATKPSKKNPDPDWTVGPKMGIDEHNQIWILDIVRVRLGPLGVDKTINNTASQDGIGITQVFWQDPGQAGKAQVATIKRKLIGLRVESVVASKNKTVYAMPVSSAAEAGNIKIAEGCRNIGPYLSTIEAFGDNKSHDDDVDATSLGFMKLVDSNIEKLRRLSKL